MEPNSSAPQNPTRTAQPSGMPSAASCRATSSVAATPLPLSLIPGPSRTESRWAPTMTTRGPSPSWPITLRNVDGGSSVATSRRTSAPSVSSSRPIASSVTLTTGIVIPAGSSSVGRKISPGPRPGYPTSSAAASAAAAFSAWSRRKHPPSVVRTRSPGETPAKSPELQPLPSSTATGPVTIPPGE